QSPGEWLPDYWSPQAGRRFKCRSHRKPPDRFSRPAPSRGSLRTAAKKHRYSVTSLAFAERVLRDIRPGSRGSLRLDVGGPDHLAPLLGFGGEELAKFGRLTGKRCIAQIAESRFHLGAHETRIGLPFEPSDDVRRRIPGGAQA